MLGVTADANIYISALNFGGLPARFIELARRGTFRLSISEDLIREVQAVLRRPKFGWPEEAIEAVTEEITGFTERVTPTETLSVVKADLADNRILECAAAAQSDYLVTGDHKHLLPLRQHGRTRIVTVGQFLGVLYQSS